MGCVYQRTERYCKTCDGKRLARRADREACIEAGHTIDERKSDVWWVKYRRGGKSYAESSDSTRKGDAVTLLRRLEGKIADGVPISPKVGRLTFDDAERDVIADYRTNGKKSLTVAERRITKHLKPFFGGRKMTDITTYDVRAFIDHRQKQGIVHHRNGKRRDVSNAEINRELSLLRRMFSLAVESGLLFHKPHIPMLTEAPARAGFLDGEQLASVLRHLPEDLRPVVEFASVTGWRIDSEVLSLEWRNVDFEAGEVRLDAGTTKNGEGRVFAFTAALRALLLAQKVKREEQAKAGRIVSRVFFRMVAEGRGGEKKPQPIISIGKSFATACRRAGCPGRIPHDLRRTAVRNLVRVGVPEGVAMKLTGHKTRSVFERYNITSPSDLRDAARRLDGGALVKTGS